MSIAGNTSRTERRKRARDDAVMHFSDTPYEIQESTMKNRLKKRLLYTQILALKRLRHWLTDEEYAWEFTSPIGLEFSSRPRILVAEKFAKFDPNFLAEGRGDQEQAERRIL
jgi:hypothetical protein